MRLLKLKKVESGAYLNYYKATYVNEDNKEKEYEFISRDKNLNEKSFGDITKTDAIGIIAFNKEQDKILLQKEFRLACNNWVYNFPGGMVDSGETVLEATKRELKEETGLNLVKIIDVLNNGYTAVGISDEIVDTVIGIAEGEIKPSTSYDEEIEASWYSKEEIRTLLKKGMPMSLRTQSFLYLWSRE